MFTCLRFCTLVVLLLGLQHAHCNVPVERREITAFPGWSGPLPSPWFNGHINCGTPPGYPDGSMYMHYVFIESENNPKTDPVLLWYNGGPGASSLFGLLIELGPLELNDESLENPNYNKTGIPQMVRNAFAWTKVANVLIVDNPPPVGFSYCDPAGPTGNGTSCGPWNDTTVWMANHQFLSTWIKVWPEYANNDLYIVGESYAGVYVPTLVRAILADPQGINLKGFAIGDGCIGTEVLCGGGSGPYYYLQFMHGHGQFSNELFNTITAQCPEQDLKNGHLSQNCMNLMMQVTEEVGGYYGYNLYDDCVDRHVFQRNSHKNVSLLKERTFESARVRASSFPHLRQWWGPPPFSVPGPSTQLGDALNGYPCPGPSMNMWLNLSATRKAFGVPVGSYFFSGDNGQGFNYTSTEKNLLPFYAEVIRNTSLRVLVYNGDTDPGINSLWTQDIYFNFMASQGIKQVHPWHPWTLDGRARMGGYVTQFQGNFSYLTIRGSGHMVPEFKPAAALAFISRWLADKDWLPYCPNC